MADGVVVQIWTLALKVVLVHPANLMKTVTVTVTLMMVAMTVT